MIFFLSFSLCASPALQFVPTTTKKAHTQIPKITTEQKKTQNPLKQRKYTRFLRSLPRVILSLINENR